jgi:phosphate acetyltransferase
VPTDEHPFAERVNHLLAEALDAKVVLIADGKQSSFEAVLGDVRIAAAEFKGRAIGCILNRIGSQVANAPPSLSMVLARTGSADQHLRFKAELEALAAAGIRPLGGVPLVRDFLASRVSDVAREIGATVLSEGNWDKRRIRSIRICAMRVERARRAFSHGSLLVVPTDRADILIGAALATLSGTELAGILLSGSDPVDPEVLEFCQPAFDTGLPLLHVAEGTYEVARLLHEVNDEIPPTDRDRASLVMNTVANHIDSRWIAELAQTKHKARTSPAAFRHRLIERARQAQARIVLPEGTEPRVLAAAHVCIDMGIARPVLIGKREEVLLAARRAGVELPSDIEIRSPLEPPASYIEMMISLRRHKGIDSPAKALDAMSEVTTFGTMMMKMGEADGLVSGAVHSTADTIRPALSLIKTRPGVRLVSSVFFMCLPDQVLVFGDCAVNPNPDADQLADIAIQSAESAEAFGIEPRVAMISYSTGSSGTGSDVDKVREATAVARSLCPGLSIDGPLQYDAAVTQSVAATKAPGSAVAGRATVLVFPDLNTGNTTYKAVQRSANVLSIGPMLQGLAMPVNDLSRGATVDDIVYTIALTAVQAAAGKRPASIRPRPA